MACDFDDNNIYAQKLHYLRNAIQVEVSLDDSDALATSRNPELVLKPADDPPLHGKRNTMARSAIAFPGTRPVAHQSRPRLKRKRLCVDSTQRLQRLRPIDPGKIVAHA